MPRDDHRLCETGDSLHPLYFNPGIQIINGRVAFSSWAISFTKIAHLTYRKTHFTRSGLGQPWVAS